MQTKSTNINPRLAQIFKLELRDLHNFENSIIRFTLSGLSVGTSTLLQAAIESWLKGFQYTPLTFCTRGFTSTPSEISEKIWSTKLRHFLHPRPC